MKIWKVTLIEWDRKLDANDEPTGGAIEGVNNQVMVLAGDPENNGGEEAIAKAKNHRLGRKYPGDVADDVGPSIVSAVGCIGLEIVSDVDVTGQPDGDDESD